MNQLERITLNLLNGEIGLLSPTKNSFCGVVAATSTGVDRVNALKGRNRTTPLVEVLPRNGSTLHPLIRNVLATYIGQLFEGDKSVLLADSVIFAPKIGSAPGNGPSPYRAFCTSNFLDENALARSVFDATGHGIFVTSANIHGQGNPWNPGEMPPEIHRATRGNRVGDFLKRKMVPNFPILFFDPDKNRGTITIASRRNTQTTDYLRTIADQIGIAYRETERPVDAVALAK